nr:alpha/beta fold hydrolase [Pseudoalteromonas sp. MMG022]
MIEQTSLLVPLSEEQSLHLRYIAQAGSTGPAVFFMHGAVENGKIFYTKSNKGLAPFLASQGYRCYVADLRGRGQSLPAISANSEYGQTESILEDIPAMLAYIEQHSGEFPRFWVAHSWGGVLMNSYFARFPSQVKKVDACVYFGSKRSLHNKHISKYFQANLIWYGLAPLYTKKHGYLPSKALKWGSDDETAKSHRQGMEWAKRKPWVDSDDGFDYAAVLRNMRLPATLHIAGIKDKALAQPIDIKKFMEESGQGVQQMKLYGRKHGHKHDYGHIDMLTHKHAVHDQFKDLLDWFAHYDRH